VEVPKNQTNNQDRAEMDIASRPGHFRMILKKKKFNLKLQASSNKPQATSFKQQA
jgi:hypothetical protein